MFTAGALIVQGSIHRQVAVTDNINDQTGKARGGKLRLDLAGLECRVIFEPVDFIAKLAALVPKPRVNLTRFHGVFAPNSKLRALVTPAKRGKGGGPEAADVQDEQPPVQRHAAMTWAQRLKRVFSIDVERCRICGGSAKVIACIEDPVVM